MRLKTVVTKVIADYADGTTRKALVIETAGGSVSSYVYAVIAVLLGVLQNDNPDNSIIFSPPLTKREQKAISRLKLGVHNKFVLRFAPEDVFWPKTVAQINCLDRIFQFLNLHAHGKAGVIVAQVFAESGYIEKFK